MLRPSCSFRRKSDFKSLGAADGHDHRAEQRQLLLKPQRDAFKATNDSLKKLNDGFARIRNERREILAKQIKNRLSAPPPEPSSGRQLKLLHDVKSKKNELAELEKKTDADRLKELDREEQTLLDRERILKSTRFDHIECCHSLKSEPPFYAVGFDTNQKMNEVVQFLKKEDGTSQMSFLPKGTLVRTGPPSPNLSTNLIPVEVVSVPPPERLQALRDTKYDTYAGVLYESKVKSGDSGYVYGGLLEQQPIVLFSTHGLEGPKDVIEPVSTRPNTDLASPTGHRSPTLEPTAATNTRVDTTPDKRAVVFRVANDTALLKHGLIRSPLRERNLRFKTINNRYVVRQCFDDSQDTTNPFSEEYIFEVLDGDLKATRDEINLNVKACDLENTQAPGCDSCRDFYKSLIAFDPSELANFIRIAKATVADEDPLKLLTLSSSGLVRIPTADQFIGDDLAQGAATDLHPGDRSMVNTYPHVRGPFNSVKYVTNDIEEARAEDVTAIRNLASEYKMTLTDFQKILMCQKIYQQTPLKQTRSLEATPTNAGTTKFDQDFYEVHKTFCDTFHNDKIHQDLYTQHKGRIDALNAVIEHNSDRFMRHDAACSFLGVLKSWNKQHPAQRLQWGDAFSSRDHGHATHHSGRCIDMRPVRKVDGPQIGPVRPGSGAYDRDGTRKLIRKLIDAGASVMYFNDQTLIQQFAADKVLTGISGHDGHIHVCFDPDYISGSRFADRPSPAEVRQRMQNSCADLAP